MKNSYSPSKQHSTAWVVQAWASFVISLAGLGVGIINLPVNSWTKGYMGIGALFAIGSTMSLAKTTRDLHEDRRINTRIDEARVEKLLAEHHPLK